MDDNGLQQKVAQLEQKLALLEQRYAIHQHSHTDGTNILRKNILLDRDQWLSVGASQFITQLPTGSVTDTSSYVLSISTGPDPVDSGVVYKSNNMQMDFLHNPATDLSFLQVHRKPLVACTTGTTVSTTAAGNTVTIAGYNFVTNELAGGIIYITDSTGAFIEAQIIASNTATVVTITGTWAASTSGGTFQIYRPVFLGSAQTIFQRNYVQEGTAGGLRIGMGPTAGGQNGLLYMDATGDLYWRDKGGVSTKLN